MVAQIKQSDPEKWLKPEHTFYCTEKQPHRCYKNCAALCVAHDGLRGLCCNAFGIFKDFCQICIVEQAKDKIYCLIAIKRFRASVFGMLPMDVVKIICRYLWDTKDYDEEEDPYIKKKSNIKA